MSAFSQQTNSQEAIVNEYEEIKTLEDTLARLSYLVVNDSLPENRFGACREFIKLLVKTLKHENSFDYPFNRLNSISIQYPQDSSFRIFTWQLYKDVDEYHYYGAIQMNTPELVLYPLIDRSEQVESVEYDIIPADKWYGSLYYNLREFDSQEGKKYLLFGFDGYSFFNKRKIIDVLSFQNGKPVFGAAVFVHQKEDSPPRTKNRVLLEYTADVAIRLNYDVAMEMILFDHLRESGGNYSGQGVTYVPDGTYEGYKLDGGYWVHVDKVFHEVMEDAPRPMPVFDNSGKKDIFGRDRKNRTQE